MRLGLSVGYFGPGRASAATPDGRPAPAATALAALVRTAEDLGLDSVWTSEAYGSDAVSVLGWLAAQTTRIGLGTAVAQMPARTPAATAMAAATLDALSGGRARLGLGVSGAQVSEGWHGVRYDAPLARTREYVALVRRALAREPLTGPGPQLPLPLPDGPGIALRLQVPARADLPVYLAATGPRNTELAGEVADGWLPVFHDPDRADDALAALARGRARCALPGGAERPLDVAPSAPLLVTEDGADLDDPAVGAPLRAHAALYLGGMGSRSGNVYAATARRAGWGAQVDAVQDAYLSGRRDEAAAAVPTGLLRATSLFGPAADLAERLAAHAAGGTTTLLLAPLAADPGRRAADLAAVVAAARAAAAAGGPAATASPTA